MAEKTNEVLKKTIKEIEEMHKERRYFMSYTLWEKSPHQNPEDKGSPRWVRSAFHTQEEVKQSILFMNAMDDEYDDLVIIPEDILDLGISTADSDCQYLNSYDVNLDSFGNIKENAVSERTGKSYPYVQRTHASEDISVRNHMFDSRYTYFAPLPFFQKYNRYANILNQPQLVVVDDEGSDITNDVVKHDYISSFPSENIVKPPLPTEGEVLDTITSNESK